MDRLIRMRSGRNFDFWRVWKQINSDEATKAVHMQELQYYLNILLNKIQHQRSRQHQRHWKGTVIGFMPNKGLKCEKLQGGLLKKP